VAWWSVPDGPGGCLRRKASGKLALLRCPLIAVAGIAAALIVRGIVVKLLIVAVALLVAAYVAGLLPPLPL